LRNALQARQALVEALQAGSRLRELLARLGQALRQELLRTLEQLLPPEMVGLDTARLVNGFAAHARALDRQLRVEVDDRILPELYRVLGEPLERVPPVPLLGCRGGPWELWQRYTQEDREGDDWRRGRIADFATGSPLAELLVGGSWSGRAYRGLLAEKIDVVSRQAVHAVHLRARARLSSLAAELDRLLHDQPPPDTTARAGLQSLLASLTEVAP
jgi:hypothetical protein